jgi:hypothetical protein
MMYALVNFGTGEIFTISGENITCQYLYNRALSQRREAVRYGYALDKMHLVRCSDYKHIMEGTVVQEWKGGLDTPIEDMGFCVPAYYLLKRRMCNTAREVAEYICQEDIFRRASRRVQLDIVRIMKPYSEEATQKLIRGINKRRAYYGQ